MCAFRGCAAVLVLCLSAFRTGHSFNLDTKIPIIKSGPEKSHFGYSVAQHKTYIPGAPSSAINKFEPWILVGAPKGENLQPGTNRSGALFKCPLTTTLTDCVQVQTDGLRNRDGLIMGPTEDEIKDDQWLGVTLKSQGQGGDILVCGHRYQHKGIGEQNFRWGYGLCYRLKNNFEYEDNYQPCMGKPVDLGHEQFGYCQAGTSGLILNDEVVLGIPGTHTWRGTIHTRNISDDYLYRDKTQYFGVYTDDDSPVNKYSYLGYSVTAGKFVDNKISYVAGAPRSEGNGQVIFFSRDRMGNPIMSYDLILDGEMFASSFGFEVLAMDTNGDKYDDLIVSAPFYFTAKSSGAIYIYMNDGSGISRETPFVRIEGAPGESRFGFSLANLGDINLDGYNDLAVGAPYENKGAIYIFLGSEEGITRTPSQVIRAEDLPGMAFEAFGYALSGGMDLDNNNYNDLLTSSFCSDRVVLLRARPIIDIQTRVDSENLQNINPTLPGCPEDVSSPEACFSFNACFRMMNEAGSSTFLYLYYNISERLYNDQISNRISFHTPNGGQPNTIESVIKLRPEKIGTYQCSRELVYIKSGSRDFLRPIRFKLSYKIHQNEPKPVEEGEPLPDINEYPILNQKEAVRYFEANFAKDCGEDDICESDLHIDGELDLERFSERDRYVFELGTRQAFTLTTNVSNDGDPAYLPTLYISHDIGIDLTHRESQCSQVESGLLSCHLENPLVGSTGPLNLVFKPSGLAFSSRFIELVTWVNSTSKEQDLSDNRKMYRIEIKRKAEISITGTTEPEQVFYSGEVVGQSAIETWDEIGTEVIHKYLVINRGPWKVDEFKVKIQWPYQTENNKEEGKWLLYMTHIPYVDDGIGECDVNPEYINPLNLGSKILIDGDSEVDTGRVDKLTGVGGVNTVSTTTQKSVKISHKKKTVTSTVKKVYTKKVNTKDSSVSSTNSVVDETGEGKESRKSYSRVSRKVYHSESDKKAKDPYQNGNDIDNYENYDYSVDENYIIHNKGRSGTNQSGRRRGWTDGDRQPDKTFRHSTGQTGVFYSHSESGNGAGGDSYHGEVDRFDSIVDLKTIKDGDKTYINGYDSAGRLVWSSRDISSSSQGSSYHHRTNNRVYEGGDGDYSNEELLSRKLSSVGDIKIVREGGEIVATAYDDYGNLLWTSRGSGGGDSSSFRFRSESKPGDRNVDITVNRRVTYGTEDPSFSNEGYNSRGESRYSTTVRKQHSSFSTDQGEPSTQFRGSYHRSGVREGDYDQDSGSGDHVYDSSSSRWVKYGGHRSNYPTNSDRNIHTSYSSSIRRNRTSSQSYSDSDDDDVYGRTYSRAVVDPGSGNVDVYSQRVLRRKSNDDWEDVRRLPYKTGGDWEMDLSSHKRTKREREFIVKPEAYTDAQTGKMMQVVNFTCDGDSPTAKCFTFYCTIRNLGADQSAGIRIPSRLWNSTLVEDYPRVSYVSIKSKGSLILPEEIRVDQDESDDVDYADTLAYSNLLEQLPPEEVPLWVILVSILAGLLLLVLIAILLWKLGFFKRKRPDPTLSGNIDRDVNGYN